MFLNLTYLTELTHPFKPKSDTAVWDKISCLTFGQWDSILNAYNRKKSRIKQKLKTNILQWMGALISAF